jgi:hypothetical protein
MSAAATAAGYLYASGRLRGRNKTEHEQDRDAHYPEVHKEFLEPLDYSLPKKPAKETKVEYKKKRKAIQIDE